MLSLIFFYTDIQRKRNIMLTKKNSGNFPYFFPQEFKETYKIKIIPAKYRVQ